MKKNFIVGLFFVTLLLYSQGLFDGFDKKKKMLFEAMLKKYGAAKANLLSSIYSSLQAQGFPATTIRLAISQVMFETGVFANKQRASKGNNFSGITYSGSAAQLATGAQKSDIALPAAEQPKTGAKVYYAKYPSILNWTKDYLRILSRGAKPIQAATPDDFAKRLKKNGYYTAQESVYAKGLHFFNNLLTKSGI
jgi:hypothetical protein